MQQPQGSAKLESLLSLRSWGRACALTLGEGSQRVLPWRSPHPHVDGSLGAALQG